MNNIERMPVQPQQPEVPQPSPEETRETAKRQLVLEQYHKKADEMGLKTTLMDAPFLGNWINTDGVEMHLPNARDSYTEPGNMDSPEIIQDRLKNIGKYNSNNGVLARIDENGSKYVMPYSDYAQDKLVELGYQSGSFGVPLSNAQEIVDPKLQQKWLHMRQESRRNNDFKKQSLKPPGIKKDAA